ncbi:MAG: hypothetical protein V4558_00815 [Gemmatimonadota bacterium]
MRLIRRISATALVASLTLLASCGDNATTQPAALDLGTREFAIAPNNPSWSKQPADPIPTDQRTVLISGLVAVASYPQFGTPVYTGANNWLDMNYAPNLSRSPLGWLVSFKLKPGAQALPIGKYTATIPVTVPAALNNPQMITVTFNNCGNCLFVGDQRDGELTTDDPRWARGAGYNESGTYPYDDWRLFVAPNTTVNVRVEGGDCLGGAYNHQDNYLYAFEQPGLIFRTSDDDSYCVNDPVIDVVNASGVQVEYLIRATSYGQAFDGSGRDFGTYRITVAPGSFFGGGGIREFEPGDKQTAEVPSLLKTKF